FLRCTKPCVLSDSPRPSGIHACIRTSQERGNTRTIIQLTFIFNIMFMETILYKDAFTRLKGFFFRAIVLGLIIIFYVRKIFPHDFTNSVAIEKDEVSACTISDNLAL